MNQRQFKRARNGKAGQVMLDLEKKYHALYRSRTILLHLGTEEEKRIAERELPLMQELGLSYMRS